MWSLRFEINDADGAVIEQGDVAAGARNLLLRCVGAKPGETLLIVFEASRLGIYGEGLAEALSVTAQEMGLTVTTREVGFSKRARDWPPDLAEAMKGADHALFLARLGDQLRFCAIPSAMRPVISYALDAEMLGSEFGKTDYRAFQELKDAVDRMMGRATDIRVTCPLGTDYRGALGRSDAAPIDTGVRRFPMSIFAPLPASGFAGRVAVARFLVGTGSHYYEPYALPLDGVIFAEFDGGVLHGFSGDANGVSRARAHYERVGELVGVDPFSVHSWHAGIHPGCAYPMAAAANYERWSCGAFGNPRILHFHTCGDYAPGEICWNVIDATIVVDGVAVWEEGVLHADRIDGGADIMRRYPDAAALFRSPRRLIGI